MGIVLKQKQKEAVAPVVKQELDVVDVEDLSDEDLADRYGSLEDKVTALAHNPLYAQFDEVKKEMAKRLEGFEPDIELEIKGHHWLLDVGVCSKKPRTLKEDAIVKIIAFLGMETFAQIAKVTIGDCEKYLTPDQVEQVVEADNGYTNNRKIVSKFLG